MNDNTAQRLPEIVADSMADGRHYVIAVDGSCIRNPGPGGYGLVKQLWNGNQLLKQAAIAEKSPDFQTTNIRMEMSAAIKAVEGIKEADTPAFILTDSNLVCSGMTEWLPGWKAKGWRGSKGPVANADLWKQLEQACAGKNTRWMKVKGHSGHILNEIADTLAINAAQGEYPKGRKSVKAAHPDWFIDNLSPLAAAA